MLINARQLGAGFEMTADVCIIGSGPAGIAAALEFVGLPIQVAVLEAGGIDEEGSDSSNSRMEVGTSFAETGHVLPGRRVGGNANLWRCVTPGETDAVRLAPLSEADFERRPWMAGSGWPISLDQVVPYYQRARGFFGLPDRGQKAADWGSIGRPLPLEGRDIRTGMVQFSSAKIVTRDHLATLTDCKNVTIYYNAPVAELVQQDSGDAITGARIAISPSRGITCRAGQFIVAAGALWTTQLLMSSGGPEVGGLGNRGGHLGRHFHTHQLIEGGTFYPATPHLHRSMKLYDINMSGGEMGMAYLEPTDAALRRDRILHVGTFLMPFTRNGNHLQLSSRQACGLSAFRRVRTALRDAELPNHRDVTSTTLGLDGLVRKYVSRRRGRLWPMDDGRWPDLSGPDAAVHGFDVLQIAEQSPHPDRRISLSDERDPLGNRKLKVNWTYLPADVDAVRQAQELVAFELAAAGLGRYEIFSDRLGPLVVERHANHFYGTTRMSDRMEHGVVDADCRVHGVGNLYVASSSVFPTAGFANPTLTIVALAIRVAQAVLARAGSR